MYTQDFIDKVRDANNIVDIISEHVELKRSGSGLLGLCPFPSHREKTPSFSVSDLKQAYFCFGCQKSGNVFTFLKEMRGMSFPETIEFLAERAHILIPAEQRKSANPGVVDQNKLFSKVNAIAAAFYHQSFLQLPPTHPARVYAAKRGLDTTLVDAFQLGISGHTSELSKHLQSKKVPMEMADKLGLVKPSRDGVGYYDMFRDRLIFPIVSTNGNYVGFGGRVLDDSLPKYLNSPETPIFSKSKTLYGLNETAKFIRTDDCVLVVEGYMDFLGLYQAGVKNVVATLGTALTKEHAQVLKRHTKNVVVLFDGDSAGQKATFRSLPILLAEGLFPRGVSLPDGMDPDDFVKKEGAEQLRNLIRVAPELFFRFIESLQIKYGKQPSDKVHLIGEAAQVLKVTADLALRDLYVADLAKRIDVQTAWLKKVLEGKTSARENVAPKIMPTSDLSNKNLKNPLANSLGAKSKPNPVGKTKIPREERDLINLALWKEKYLKQLIDLKVLALISNESLGEVFNTAVEAYRQSPKDFDKLTVLLFSKFDDLEVITDHLNPRVFNFSDEDGDKLFRDCLIRMKENAFKSRAKALILGLKKDEDFSKLEQFVNEIKNRARDMTE